MSNLYNMAASYRQRAKHLRAIAGMDHPNTLSAQMLRKLAHNYDARAKMFDAIERTSERLERLKRDEAPLQGGPPHDAAERSFHETNMTAAGDRDGITWLRLAWGLRHARQALLVSLLGLTVGAWMLLFYQDAIVDSSTAMVPDGVKD